MALSAAVLNSFEALKKAERELDNLVYETYSRGTRVSFRKFTYHGVQDVPMLTGTVLWANLKAGDMPRINVSILLDEPFIPCDWINSNGDKTCVLINALEKEYDITIIGKDENF